MMESLPLVHKAAETFRQYCYEYRDNLVAGIIVAGWDPKLGGQVSMYWLNAVLFDQTPSTGGILNKIVCVIWSRAVVVRVSWAVAPFYV